MSGRINYWNGFAVVMLVCTIVSLIPMVGTVSAMFSSSEETIYSTYIVDSKGYVRINVYTTNSLVLGYMVENDASKFNVYILSSAQAEDWNDTNSAPSEYIRRLSGGISFTTVKSQTFYAIVLYNSGQSSVTVKFFIVTASSDLTTASIIFASLFLFFLTMLTLHTIGYILNILIFRPISGGYSKSQKQRRGNKLEDHKGELVYVNGKYYYRYVEKPTVQNASTTQDLSHTETQRSTTTTTPKSESKAEVLPPIETVSLQGVHSKKPAFRPHKSRFVAFLEHIWLFSYLPEKILAACALFFFVLGITTRVWFLIAVMPVGLLAAAAIVYNVNTNRREKVIQVVGIYKALYVKEIARLLNSDADIVRSDVWKIINLGLANIAYDVAKDIVYLPEITDKQEINPGSHPKMSIEELICPFCETKNPTDSAFCIKCGASLKPAK